MAIFAVLSLMVVFTVLGVAAITLAQRDNSSSGSVLDIKQREAASYSGLIYAQNELTRDPENFLDILERWRKKQVYADTTGPFVPLFLKFHDSNKVEITRVDPGFFTIPGTATQIKVEIKGISQPTASQEPRIALLSTGISATGDEQSVLGVYQIKNIRVSSNSNPMPITSPLYVSGGGDWNNTIRIQDGNAYFGNNTHLNSSVKDIVITNAGLRVYGDFTWDDLNDFIVDNDVYINGKFLMHSIKGTVDLRRNLVITGNLEYASSGTKISVRRSLYVLGNPGFLTLQSELIDVGTGAGVADAIFYLPNGELVMGKDSWIRVNGSAFLRKISSAAANPFALDVSKRLELAHKGLNQSFYGAGKWGQLVVRSADATSVLANGAINIPASIPWGPGRASDGIKIGNAYPSDSWVGSMNFKLGAAGDSATMIAPRTMFGKDFGKFYLTGPKWMIGMVPASVNLSPAVTAEGFDSDPTITPPTPFQLTNALPPSDQNDREPTLDWVSDPTALKKAWVAKGSPSCADASKICGKAIMEAYRADSASRQFFHNDFFVVKLTGAVPWTWDFGGKETSLLNGRFLFYVEGDMGGSMPWPTTAPNLSATNPENVIFVYGKGAGKIFAGFSPRYKNDATTPVEFTGYVRYDATTCGTTTWNPATDLTFKGAVHIVGPNPDVPGSSRCANFTINSGTHPTTSKPFVTNFRFDQATLNVIGASFGNNFIKPDGTPLGIPPNQFFLLENWIQLRPLGELR